MQAEAQAEQDTGSTGLVCTKASLGLQGRAWAEHPRLSPSTWPASEAVSGPAAQPPSCLTSQSNSTTFGERGRCSLISPTDSFADKKLFSSKPFVLPFVLVGLMSFSLCHSRSRLLSTCPAVAAAFPRSSGRLTLPRGSHLPPACTFLKPDYDYKAPLKGELIQPGRRRCSVQPVHSTGQESSRVAAAEDRASTPLMRVLPPPPSDCTRAHLGNRMVAPLLCAFLPLSPPTHAALSKETSLPGSCTLCPLAKLRGKALLVTGAGHRLTVSPGVPGEDSERAGGQLQTQCGS